MPIITGPSGSSGGSLTLLSTTTLGADGTFDVSGISQAYTDLLLVPIIRCTRAATNDLVGLRLNNDSGGNYERQTIDANLTTLAAAASTTQTFAWAIAGCPAASSPANTFGVAEIWLHGYKSTSWNKNIVSLNWGNYNGATNRELNIFAGQWSSTAAITRVQLFGTTTANLLVGSQLRIYGRL